ncbi:regulatory protein RecX [Teredinibacter sp. KSP-S5-2]|uniref:regulatory protein RecX n=1 Tax=Teredinibacter sp. KSP-S5-2 TaxID=3034506 RepID=UPI002934BA56|nr:regulatory protein RecX [Teredinibacter sp. KSP-S5-2]WNO10362.1 regulatory protein RecX [Teredinibacter sp. KSP-S5-2]
MTKDQQASLYNAALALLARREHSSSEIKIKLKRKFSSSDELIDKIIYTLIDQGYLSDERFAEAYIRSRARKGFGPVRITQELNEKGVSSEVISRGFDETDWDWNATAQDVLRKKYKSEPQDFKEKMKQQNFLRYRGFDLDSISSCFD